ncbi:D-alanyl-D-alanine carboxypeptidase [Neisseriaceae bacterium ESL0693]|nr:D-alanyl-D-alanine carboxypeptidase [Neisseriaceae bacterium ESL0693]
MNKIILILICCLGWLAGLPVAKASALPPINAAAYIVSDEQSGRILARHEASARIEPAALTQLMTAYLVFQALERQQLSLKQPLVVSEAGWQVTGSRLFMQPGQPVATQTVIQGMLTIAANDAALTLAQAVAGNEAAFVRQMNHAASKMGLKNSHFVNCTGLPAVGQYSSAEDILTLARALWQDFPQYRSWFGQKKLTHHGLTQLNHNLLLFRDASIEGLATGSSINGGYHLAALSQKNKRQLMVVVMGADSSVARAIEAGKLLEWAQNEFNTVPITAVNHPIAHLSVYHGRQAEIAVGLQEKAYITLPNHLHTTLTLQLEATQPVLAPIRKGQVLGKLIWRQHDKVVAQKNVVALQSVSEAAWWQRW